MTKQISIRVLFALLFSICINLGIAQETDEDLDKIRSESGVDPTRVMSRAGYTIMVYDKPAAVGQINNRVSMNLGINRWSLSAKYDYVIKSPSVPGSGFNSGLGDIKFSILNAFFVKGNNAMAGAVEFSLPSGKGELGSQYFTATPSVTYSYTINPTLFFAVQPQYTFDLLKDPLYPSLSVLTVRAFLAKFTKKGYFFVFEPRPIIDFENNNFDLIISPIIGKALGGGFNLIGLVEIPTSKSGIERMGALYQFGFNKSF
jgi:hypothetical protein